jgi:serine/threonine protein kinase
MNDETETCTGIDSESELPEALARLPRQRVERIDDARMANPTRVGRYKLLRRIGAGGMGVVFEAVDTELGRRVAVKMVRMRDGATALSRQERLVHEARALARLDHPNVVTIHDVGVVDTAVYITMAYIEGVTLMTWVRERRPSRQQLLAVFVELGRGLAAAHAAGLVHRDFKPSNVLIDGEGHPQIVDFGLAKHVGESPDEDSDLTELELGPMFEDLTRNDAVPGTPKYMSPEQRQGRPIDARVDQYAYCLSLGEALFVAGLRTPRALRRALARGLAQEPDARWPDMDTLSSALDRIRRRPRRLGLFALGVAVLGLNVAALVHAAASPSEQDRSWSSAGVPWRGPVLHWSFDEGSGELVGDAAELGGQAHGNPHRTTEVAPISVGNPSALRFDGIDDHVTASSPEIADFDTNQDFTIALWVKPDRLQVETDTIDNDIVDKWAEGTGFPFTIRYFNRTTPEFAGHILVARFDSRPSDIVSREPIHDGEFHHVAFVKRGQDLQLYIDGTLDGATIDISERTTKTPGRLTIGRRMWGSNHFAGVIDDLYIYDRGLSAPEIAALCSRSTAAGRPYP